MIRKFLSAAAITLALGGTASAATVLSEVFSDNFNADTQGLNASLINWNVAPGTVDVIGGPSFFNFYPGNGNYLDMNGSTKQEGTITTKSSLGLVMGKEYTLTFDYGTNTSPGAFPVFLTFGLGTALETLEILSRPAILTNVLYTFIYDGTGDFLSFADTSGTRGDNGGPVIDNVVLSAVPLPAGGLLLLAGLGGLAALRRRKALI